MLVSPEQFYAEGPQLTRCNSFADEAKPLGALWQVPHTINCLGGNAGICSQQLGVWRFARPVVVVHRWTIQPGHGVSWKQRSLFNPKAFQGTSDSSGHYGFLLSLLSCNPNHTVWWMKPKDHSCSRTKRFSFSLLMVKTSEVLTGKLKQNNKT